MLGGDGAHLVSMVTSARDDSSRPMREEEDCEGVGRAKERELELERHVLEVETCFSNTNLTRHDGKLSYFASIPHASRKPGPRLALWSCTFSVTYFGIGPLVSGV